MTAYPNPFADLTDNEAIDAIHAAYPDDTVASVIADEPGAGDLLMCWPPFPGRPVAVETCHDLNQLAAQVPNPALDALGTIQFALPAGYALLSANDRHDYRAKARIVKQIRADAISLARSQKLPRFTQVRITAVLHPRDKRHQDSDNVQPTVKACIDGLVEGGYLPNDDERYVLSTTYILGQPVKGGQLVLCIYPEGELT